MASPVLVQDKFVRMVRDKSRDQLDDNECWNLADYIPDELGAPLRKRGGYENEGSTLFQINASANSIHKVVWAPFSAPWGGGAQLIAIDVDGRLLKVLPSESLIGTAVKPAATPTFYRELLIIPKAAGDAVPKRYNGTAIADLGGSPPNATLSAVYKDRLLLAAATATKNRIYFSGAGNSESWDTTNRYLDTSSPVVGLAPLKNAILVYHDGTVERIRGDIPPGSAAANMVLESLFNDVGMFSYDALAVSGEYAFFADENGVYQTDGASLSDLVEQGGIKHYYRTQVASIGSTGQLAVGVWRGYLFVSMLASNDDYVDFLVCELRTRRWFRFTNIKALNFSAKFGTSDEMYFANPGTGTERVSKLSSVFSPSSSVKNDGNTVAVIPTVETGMYDLGHEGKKRFRDLYVGYDLRDAGSDNPTLAVSYLTSPEATSYTSLSSLSESTAYSRSRVPVAVRSKQIAFKVAQANASSDTRLYGLELVAHPLEGSGR